MKFLLYQLGKNKTRSVPVKDDPSNRWSNYTAEKGGYVKLPFEDEKDVNTIYAMSKVSKLCLKQMN